MPFLITRGTLEMLLDECHRKVGLDLRVCLPAKVVQFVPAVPGPRPTPPRAIVQIDLKYARDGRALDLQPDGTGVPEVPGESTDPREAGELVGNYPPLLVPVHYPGPWGMWARGPLLPGELGKLVWCDRSIDSWQIEGGSLVPGSAVDPVFSHTHGGMGGGPMNDAWFEPGIRSGSSMAVGPPGTAPSVVDPAAWTIGTADGFSVLKITAPGGGAPVEMELSTLAPLLVLEAAASINGGKGAVDPVALAPAVIDLFTKLVAALNAWVPIPNDGGAALKTALGVAFLPAAAGLIAQIAATKFKAE